KISVFILIIIFLSIFFVRRKEKEFYKKDDEKTLEYYSYNSKINSWNPHLKFWYSMVLIVLGIILSNIYISISIVFICGFITIFLGKISLKKYIDFFKVPIIFLLISVAVININFSKNITDFYYFNIGDLYIYTTDENIRKSCILFWRALSGVSSMYMLALSTPLNEIIYVMKKARTPKIIIELMYLVYRFIFIMRDSYKSMRKSIESRLGFRDYRISLLSFGKIISNILIISLRKSNSFYDAMESRCYRGEIRFFIKEKRINKKVIIGMGLSIIYLIVLYIFTK
ncbi:cobalt ECF transporter T component CbiQ, partial [uncultured Fusobacterium sp.]|uniref:cobalt ECF transporter T component CbiQ n=1 Tax=uncultured Fusobacterium sp. TaxID=159267 RepID=UPI0015A5A5FC